MEMTEAMLKKFIETRQTANKKFPEHKEMLQKEYQVDEKYNNLTLNEQAVFIESIFRTLSQNFKSWKSEKKSIKYGENMNPCLIM